MTVKCMNILKFHIEVDVYFHDGQPTGRKYFFSVGCN